MKVGIFGPCGHIGRHLTAFLDAKGVKWEGFSTKDATGLDPKTGKLPPSWKCPPDLNAMIYLSHSPYYEDENSNQSHLFNVNSLAPLEVAFRAKEAGVTKFIFFSSASVYQFDEDLLHEESQLNRESPYALSKIHGEEALNTLPGLDLSILRPFHVYGPGQERKLFPELVRRIESNQSVYIQPHYSQTHDIHGYRLSLIYIDDLIQLLWKILTLRSLGCLNIASPEPISIREFAMAIGDVLGKKVNFEVRRNTRAGERIASTSKLQKSFPQFKFTSLNEGLKNSLWTKDF